MYIRVIRLISIHLNLNFDYFNYEICTLGCCYNPVKFLPRYPNQPKEMLIQDLLHKSVITVLFTATLYYGGALAYSSYTGFSKKPDRKKVSEGDISKRIIEIRDKFEEIDEKRNTEELVKQPKS